MHTSEEQDQMSSEAANANPSNFVWYEFHTPDADATEAFYRSVLGWGAQDGGMADRRYDLMTVGKTAIGGILEKPADSFTAGAKPGWVGYIGVDNVDRFSQRVQQAGGVVHRAAEDIPGVGRFAVVADPQGVIFVLFQPSDPMQQPERPRAGTPGSAAWHDLTAIEWQSEFTFYANLFGWSKTEAMNMGPDGVYQMFAAGSETIGGMMTRMDPSHSPGWLFYFNVEEIDSAVLRVKQNGGKVVRGPLEVPGGQRIAHCVDPQGAIFGIVSPKS